MKKIVIIIVVLLVLGGGGFAAWKFFMGGETVPQEAADHPTGPIYVSMEPFVIQVFRDDRVVKNISLAVQIEVESAGAEAKVHESMPYLRDAYLRRLHAALSRGEVGQNYDEAKLKRQLLAESDDILGPGVVTAILIGNTVEKTRTP